MKKLYLVVLSLLTIFLVACNQIPGQDDPLPTIKYDLTFMVDQSTVYHVFKVELGSPMQYPVEPTKDGYVFDGWYAGDLEFEGTVVTADALILFAHFVPDTPTVTTHIVTFYQGNKVIYSTQVESGSTISDVVDTTKAHYEFEGWYTDSELTTSFDLFTPINGTTLLYGKWNPIYYTVNFYRGMDLYAAGSVRSGESINSIDTNIEGYQFVDWYTDSIFSTPYNQEVVTSDINLYGKWSANTISVTYFKDTNIFAQRSIDAGSIAPTIDTTIHGHEFEGWYLDSLLTTPYHPQPLTKSTWLYGKWTADTIDVTYFRGGNVFAQESVSAGSSAPVINTTISGYEFQGWYLDASFTTLYQSQLLTESTWLYGKWVETQNPDPDPNPDNTYSGYYSSLNGLSDAQLKTVLTNMIKTNGSSGGTTSQVTNADKWQGQSYNIYTGLGSYGNREHVVPASKLRDAKAPEDDLQNLRASLVNVNSTRGNDPFGPGSGGWKSSGGKFYPGDEHIGDVARIVLYITTRHNVPISAVGNLQLFLEWHQADPVNDFERTRNDRVYSVKNHRNPFIDHPELVFKMWTKPSKANTDTLFFGYVPPLSFNQIFVS